MNIWQNSTAGYILSPLSLTYRAITELRRLLYKKEILPSIRIDAIVISIGNITVGGSGKTPLVETIAEHLLSKGYRPAILSRGYGRKGGEIVIVSDGKNICTQPKIAGDEPSLLAKNLQTIPVIVGQDRTKSGAIAVKKMGCNILILDDGFQHLRMKRDLDIVVVNGIDPWGNGQLLPAGPLREPLTSLREADIIIISRKQQIKKREKVIKHIRRYTDSPVIFSDHKPLEFVRMDNKKILPLDHLKDRKVVAFAGIGSPESFRKSLEELNIKIERFVQFRDHHWYTKKDIQHILDIAEKYRVDGIVTTEKDSFRIPYFNKTNFPLYYLRIKFEIHDTNHEFSRKIDSLLRGAIRQ